MGRAVASFDLAVPQQGFLQVSQYAISQLRRQQRQSRLDGAHLVFPAGSGVAGSQCIQLVAGFGESGRKAVEQGGW
jgi:hypothetical protein